MTNKELIESIQTIDDKLSQRFIALDPLGYFLIKVDYSSNELILEHYTNQIDELGRALDSETGMPINCNDKSKRQASTIYKGKTAKDLGIKISEGNQPLPISQIDHAIYLGRELQRAEECLKKGIPYIQD